MHNHINNHLHSNKINENSINIKVGANKNLINEDKSKNNNNKNIINDKGRILLKPATKSKAPINPTSNYFNNEKNSTKNTTKNTSKNVTTTNKGNLGKNKEKKHEKKKTSNEVKVLPKLNNNNKGVITDEDYIANYNFEDIDEEQFLQQAIEQSIKEQAKK